MAMTKKDYQLIATALANQRGAIDHRLTIEFKTLDETIENIAAHFALMNDKFNKEIFLEASDHGKSSND